MKLPALFFLSLFLGFTRAFSHTLQPVAFLPSQSPPQSAFFDAEALRKTTARVFQEKGYLIIPPEALDLALQENQLAPLGPSSIYLLAEITGARSFLEGQMLNSFVYNGILHIEAKFSWYDTKGYLLSSTTIAVEKATENEILEELLSSLYEKMASQAELLMSAFMKLKGIVTHLQDARTFSFSLGLKDGVQPGSKIRVEAAGEYVGAGLVVGADSHQSTAIITDLVPAQRIAPNQTVYVVELKEKEKQKKKSSPWLQKTGRLFLSLSMVGLVFLLKN